MPSGGVIIAATLGSCCAEALGRAARVWRCSMPTELVAQLSIHSYAMLINTFEVDMVLFTCCCLNVLLSKYSEPKWPTYLGGREKYVSIITSL